MAIVHDFLFITGRDTGRKPTREDWPFANQVMVAGMQAAQIKPWIFRIIKWAPSTRFSWIVYADRTPLPRYIDLDRTPLKAQGFDPKDTDTRPIA